MSAPAATSPRQVAWIPRAGLLVIVCGVWGASSSLPTSRYDDPAAVVHVVWAFTTLVPAVSALRGTRFDRSRTAMTCGPLIGPTDAGGQLLLVETPTPRPASVVFPVAALSPATTVLMALVVLGERLTRLTAAGVVLALVAIILFSISPGGEGVSTGSSLLPAALVCAARGGQDHVMREAATVGAVFLVTAVSRGEDAAPGALVDQRVRSS